MIEKENHGTENYGCFFNIILKKEVCLLLNKEYFIIIVVIEYINNKISLNKVSG